MPAKPRWPAILSLALVLLLNARVVRAQDAAAPPAPTDSAPPQSVDVTNEVLGCAQYVARSAGFETQLSISGRLLHAWRPHLQSMDTNETDYVRVQVYARGSAKGFRWEVKAHTVTGRAMITTSVYSPRPPSRDADALRRNIMKTCAPDKQ